MQKVLRVYFDQNCMNARGTDPALCSVDALATSGSIELVSNPRNRFELRDDKYASMAHARLKKLPETMEYFRLDASPMDTEGVVLGVSSGADVGWLFRTIFPNQEPTTSRLVTDPGQNSLHDVMHIANAEDGDGDVFITRDNAILRARPRLRERLRICIETPEELLARFINQDANNNESGSKGS